jgi:hypothetical protein
MSRDSEEGTESEPQEGQATEDAKTFDAEYVDKLRKESARYRTEAKANSDAAKELGAIKAANQTESEKVAQRIADLETELGKTRQDTLRLGIAAKHGITEPDDISLFLTGTDEETLTAQAKRLAEREVDRKKSGNRVPKEGTITQAKDDGMREFARSLFNKPD